MTDEHSHLDELGRFQSDRHPTLEPDKIVLSFKDPLAIVALLTLASAYRHKDPQLSADIRARVSALHAGQA